MNAAHGRARLELSLAPFPSCFWIVSAALLLCAALTTLAAAQPVSPKNGGGLPDVMLELLRDDPMAFQFRRALKGQVQLARRNRELMEQGALKGTPELLAELTAVTGVRKVPVMLGKFSDTGADPIARGDLQQELFDGPWPTGTMTEFYEEISYGNLQINGTVYDWVEVANDDDYYTAGVAGSDPASAKTGEFITEILSANDATVNFAEFDNDGPDGIPNSGDDDGYVDFIGIVHPEDGSECYGRNADRSPVEGTNFWSHRWALSYWTSGEFTTNDAKAGGGFIKVDDYTIMPAVSCGGAMIEIGVFCHEFGHAFGLPDYYDTDGGSDGIGHWGLMGAGNWNTPTRPAHMSAFCKTELGWIVPGVVTSDLINWPIVSSTRTPTAFKLWSSGMPGSEYFLVENRTADGFDDQIWGPGLLIWHVDEGAADNTDERHKKLDLECADQTGADHTTNADDLDVIEPIATFNRGDAGDPFCNGDEFSAATNPSPVAYSGTMTTVEVRNINNCGDVELIADLIVGQAPEDVNLCMRDCGSDTCFEPSSCSRWWASPEIYIDNDGDGIIDPPADGIPNRMFAKVRNVGGDDANNVDVDFYYADPAMGLLFPSAATYIDSDNIPVIAASGAQVAGVEWTIPVPPATIDHYCVGVVATNATDGQSSESAPQDNNLAQINIQALFEKAGEAVPKTVEGAEGGDEFARARAAGDFFQAEREVLICNPDPELQCWYDVLIGSPPNYDDAVIPGNWIIELDPVQGILSPGKCEILKVRATNVDAVHTDAAIVPLTLLCNQQPIGGTILEFHIDNFPPPAPCSFSAVQRWNSESDDAPGETMVELSWTADFFDVLGFSERVERWYVHEGATPGFAPNAGNLILETCIDETPGDGKFHHFEPAPPEGLPRFYTLIAEDRAGNRSESCEVALFSEIAVGAPNETANRSVSLEQNFPNPFNPSTQIRFALNEAGPVRLDVYTVRGQLVRNLVSGVRDAGGHRVVWDGRDEQGRSASSGTYVYRLLAGGTVSSRRMILLK